MAAEGEGRCVVPRSRGLLELGVEWTDVVDEWVNLWQGTEYSAGKPLGSFTAVLPLAPKPSAVEQLIFK